MTHTLELGKSLPEKRIRAGAISATVWTNRRKDGECEYRTISFERSYKDTDGAWQTTNSLRITDLPKAELVLRKAFEYCQLGEMA